MPRNVSLEAAIMSAKPEQQERTVHWEVWLVENCEGRAFTHEVLEDTCCGS